MRLRRLRAPTPPFCSDLTALRGRYANLAELGEEERENKLEAKTVEYLVHGLFARSEKGMGEGSSAPSGAPRAEALDEGLSPGRLCEQMPSSPQLLEARPSRLVVNETVRCSAGRLLASLHADHQRQPRAEAG